MYQSSKIGLSIRYDECKYSGINCKQSDGLGDIKLTFNIANAESWAIKVICVTSNMIYVIWETYRCPLNPIDFAYFPDLP